jgi:hypothetical protein
MCRGEEGDRVSVTAQAWLTLARAAGRGHRRDARALLHHRAGHLG